MKKLISAFFLLLTGCVFVNAQELQVFLSNDVFYSPESGTYLETHILIPGEQLSYRQTESKDYRATVEVTLAIKQDDEIIDFDKYLLHSLDLSDSSLVQEGLVDQKRFLLKPGAYMFEALFKDFYNPENMYRLNEAVIVDDYTGGVRMSDIELVESYKPTEEISHFYKNGLQVVPYVINYYPKHVNKLSFYAEVYNTDSYLSEDAFAVKYFLEVSETGKVLNTYGKVMKYSVSPVNVVLNSLNITDLASGNYNLVIQARDKQNELLTEKKLFFQRSNPTDGPDYAEENYDADQTFAAKFNDEEINYQLKSLLPIASRLENNRIRNLLRNGSTDMKRNYFYGFWLKRNADDPSLAWYVYSEKVEDVNASYSTNIDYGFETDRGRVYLQYGPPHEIFRSPFEPGAQPYEIWHYYTLGTQNNIKFVFSNSDLVSNNYELVHSNATGELSNPKWRTVIYNDFEMMNDGSEFDKLNRRDHYGSHSEEYFEK